MPKPLPDLARLFCQAWQQKDETSEELHERKMQAWWDGIHGRRYVAADDAISGMGPMPEWLEEDENGVGTWMQPEAVWGAWCNVCLEGMVGLIDVVQHWYFVVHGSKHLPTVQNDFATATEMAKWELDNYGKVTEATTHGLLKRIERLEHRIRGQEVAALMKETVG